MTEGEEPSAIEEAAGEGLGVEPWDRPLIFREAADAAVDNSLPYWLVLILSGAIATLGLALDSAAVVIGAMLVAPLLAPIVGLSLALAVGDSRLALQTFGVVGASLVAVIATAAGLTALLPFHTLTLEISSRIRPTTLDLGVAVSSGLVGAVVTVARGRRLSAAIPGVAVAVALIPPLAVAGFGMAAGWRTDVIWGALLLLGANLAGIVLSGVLVFLLIGMHRQDVVEAARRWHAAARPGGVAGLVGRLPGAGRAEVFGSVLGRVVLVLAFVGALAVPLTAALREVVRETRVRGAVAEAISLLEAEGTTSVLGRQVELGPDSTVVRVRVATGVGVSEEARQAFVRRAAELAHEPVTVRLEQLPAAAGGASALQAMLRGGEARRSEEEPEWPQVVEQAREALERAVWPLPFPEEVEPVAVDLRVGGGRPDSAEVVYLAPDTLDPQAVEVLRGALRQAVAHPPLAVSFRRVGPVAVPLTAADTAGLAEVVALLRRYPALRPVLRRGPADSLEAAAVLRALRELGVDSLGVERGEGDEVEVRLARSGEGSG